jgi:tetratricopeptide (TPR) repeat protein
MDCRRASRLARVLLFPGSLVIAAGCALTTSQELVNPPPQVAVQVKKEVDLPKITPKAASCVAGAEFCRVEASSPKSTAAQREDFRERARKGYQQALEQEPNNQTALHGLARLYVDLNDHERAVATYQRALKLAPKDASLSFELGMTHARWQEWEPAIAHLKTALDLEPENKHCASTLGHCLARAGHYEEALALFTKTVGEARAHYNLARMLHHMQRDDLCREQLSLALGADPQLTEARELLMQLSSRPPDEGPQSHRQQE